MNDPTMTTADSKVIQMTEFGPLVETGDGSLTIRHAAHGQDFHSSEGARFEAWELYVVASGFRDLLGKEGRKLRVLDVGMGLGYNASATIACWLSSGGTRDLEMVSLEIDERLPRALMGAAAPWCQGWAAEWCAGLKNLKSVSHDMYESVIVHPVSGRTASWTILIGDANSKDLSAQISQVDYIWQDPFTPELNPTMWSEAWFRSVASVASSDAQLMTYSVSRLVKDALTAGGWHHERFRTPGRKRHWLRAALKAPDGALK